MHKFVHIRAYLFIYLKFLRPFNVYIFNEYLNLYISFFFFFSLSLSSCMTITGFRRIPLLFLIPYHRIQVTMRCRKHTGSGSSMRRGDVYCRLRSFLTLNSLPCSANHRFCCSRFSETRGVGAIPADDRSTVSLRLGTVGGLAAGRLAQTCQGLQAILHILRCCDFGYT